MFGKNRDRGIRLRGLDPEVVQLGPGGASEDDLLCHDERAPEPSLAFLLSRMCWPEFPEPIGVFRAVDHPRYEAEVERQISEARKKGAGDLTQLFHSGDTWSIEP